MGHLLELVTKIAFNNLPETEETMADAHSLVRLFSSRSTQAMHLLLLLKDCILILNFRGSISTNLTDRYWTVLQDIIVLLKPFMYA